MSATRQIPAAEPADAAEATDLRAQTARRTPTDSQAPAGTLSPSGAQAHTSPSGPIARAQLPLPPLLRLPRTVQQLRFGMRQASFLLAAQRQLGDVFRISGVLSDDWIAVTSNPQHVRALFTASPALVPSLTGESPLRPIVGPSSVLTLLGERHMRQRRLLLPPFHGEAVQRYVQMIERAAQREIDVWPVGEPFALAPRMQAITLEVIMAGVFGVEGLPPKGTLERRLRDEIRRIVDFSTKPLALIAEIVLLRRARRGRVLSGVIGELDRMLYALITERRQSERRSDILSMLLDAVDEDGRAMSSEELRDELITLVLAGHETTANSLAWAFERLLRHGDAYDRLRELVRAQHAPQEAADYIEACIQESMRTRPVVPSIGRRVTVPWRLGAFDVPSGAAIMISILLLHHREDVYPQPFAFSPERFLGVKPGTCTWIPFGGGVRRCLGATLALAEQRAVMRAVAARTDMVAPDPQPERMRHRNVTMVPGHGALVKIVRRLPER